MLLGLWIRVFGDGEAATHSLSLALRARLRSRWRMPRGAAVFDRRTGFVCALLVAVTRTSRTTRRRRGCTQFESFLSLVAVLAYVNGILRGRRLWAVVLVPTLALMVYGHNWALFFCVALALATVLYARERLRLFGLVALGVAVLYVPWVPTLLSQARHTGAPWSTRPSFHELFTAGGAVLGGDAPFIAFLVASARRAGVHARRASERVLVVLAGATILLAWFVVADLACLDDALLRRRARPGGAARRQRSSPAAGGSGSSRSSQSSSSGAGFSVRNEKENAKQIAAQLAPYLQPGELVVSTHPEQVPVLRYYLGGGLRWATTLGPVADPQVFDWRDAVSRLRAAQPRATLDPLARLRAARGRVRRRRAGLPRLPRLEGQVDAPRLAEGRWRGRRCSSTTRGCGSSTTS